MFSIAGLVQLRKKVEKLKVARDYSFLEDDRGVPAPAKEPPPRNVSAPTSGRVLHNCFKSVFYL